MALALDPFVQQVLSFPIKVVPDPTLTSTIPKARFYTSGFSESGASLSPQGRLGNFAYGFQDAILRGIYSTNTDVEYTCSTGNCSCPNFNTLAVCSHCLDVTAQLTKECHSSMTTSYFVNNGTTKQHYQDCVYTFAGGASLQSHSSIDSFINDTDRTTINITSSIQEFGPLPVRPTGDLAKVSVLTFPPSDRKWNDSKPFGSECTFTWCVESHKNSSATNGVLTDIPTTTKDLTFGPCPQTNLHYVELSNGRLWHSIPYFCPAFSQDQVPRILAQAPKIPNVTIDNLSQFLSSDTARENNQVGLQLLKSPDAWLVSLYDYIHLQTELQSFFNTSYGSGNYPYQANTIARLNDGNISETMSSIARSLTSYIRQGPNSTVHNGTTSVVKTFIAVNWAWSALPIVLVVVAAGFLAACMQCHMQLGQSPWKSATLAVLFHGLMDFDLRRDQLATVDDMKESARSLMARLDENDDGRVALLQR